MRKLFIITITAFMLVFYACESSEDISKGFDHEVPTYRVLTDSLVVQTGQTVALKVEIADNAGLKKVVFSYGNWFLFESIALDELGNPKSYVFETSITIPDDAEKQWSEELIRQDGSKRTITQQYHKLILEATDINMNVRNIPIYIKVE